MTAVLNAMKVLLNRARLVKAGGLNDQALVPSPCVSVCEMDADRAFCIGCLRTLDELRVWGKLDNADKRAVWQLIESRMP